MFTPDNLLENLHRLGPWSALHLAEIAICYERKDIARIKDEILFGAAINHYLRDRDIKDVIREFHNEVGYHGDQLHPNVVNEN